MAYTPTTWANGDVITAEKLNKLETGVQNEQVGPAGPKGEAGPKGADGKNGANGKDGLSVKAIALTTTDGKVTGGEATLTDDSKVAITVSGT